MPSFIHKPRRKLLLIASGAVALVMVGMLVGFVILLSGAYSTAATTQHFKITHRLLDAGLRYSVRAYARNIEAPRLDAPGMLERGAACYHRYCVQCHGGPGIAPSAEGRGQLPIASNLTQSAREWPAPWLYYVTRKGIRMSGMPAWEFRMSDHSLWSTVAFLQQLPQLTVEDYTAITSVADSQSCEPASELTAEPNLEYAKVVFRQYACHSCHQIEGVVGPKSRVGPRLAQWSRRGYIAGSLPNTRQNLIRFIRAPQSVREGTLMPDLQVSEAHAAIMADYLLTL